jgi:hypothetical protein
MGRPYRSGLSVCGSGGMSAGHCSVEHGPYSKMTDDQYEGLRGFPFGNFFSGTLGAISTLDLYFFVETT